jgi:3-hydroxyisobutyrate dehydrogenase-like beta-hydroxyacid dehydrogenase
LCPPAFASDVAESVAEKSFRGLYVEANALAPEQMKDIANRLERAGAMVVDASVIGSPPTTDRQTELYVSGPAQGIASVVGVFDQTSVTVRSLGAEVGQASALKMAFSAYQKAARTLAGVAHGLAREHGVEGDLRRIAQQHTTNYLADVDYVPKTAARAWRWAPEMREVGAALRAAGLPSELADAAASVMDRWIEAKDRELSVDEALALLGHAPESK